MRTAFVFLTVLMLVVAPVTASGRLYLILAGSSGIQALAFTTLFDNLKIILLKIIISVLVEFYPKFKEFKTVLNQNHIFQ